VLEIKTLIEKNVLWRIMLWEEKDFDLGVYQFNANAVTRSMKESNRKNEMKKYIL
jgi:hypothetical protein